MSRTFIGEGKFAKQVAGRGAYGHVRLRVVLDDGVQGVVFTNAVVADAIPTRFLRAIESGVMTLIKAGMLEQCGYNDARIELYDGSSHDVDSNDFAFFLASAMALENALRRLPRVRHEGERGEDGTAGVAVPRAPGPTSPQDAAAVAEPVDPNESRRDVRPLLFSAVAVPLTRACLR